MQYIIRGTTVEPTLNGDWDAEAWARADVAALESFRPESSVHRPRTQVRLLYDEQALHGIFRVEDRFVRCVHHDFQDAVCRDSCVEFFFKPHLGPGYMNFEFNCGGAFLAYYIHDWRRVGDDGLAGYTEVSADLGKTVKVCHSLPKRTEPERDEPTTWTLQFRIPLALIAEFAGPLGTLDGRTWTGNFYKCGDETSHPHWAAWAPVNALNFHLPECFGDLVFR